MDTQHRSYDAVITVIAVIALQHDECLLARDERAAEVYERLGADVPWVST